MNRQLAITIISYQTVTCFSQWLYQVWGHYTTYMYTVKACITFRTITYYTFNIMSDKLLLNFGAKILALIYNFTCEITKLPWQPFQRSQNGVQVWRCYRFWYCGIKRRFRKSTVNQLRALRTGVTKMPSTKALRSFLLNSWMKLLSGFIPLSVTKTEPTTNLAP